MVNKKNQKTHKTSQRFAQTESQTTENTSISIGKDDPQLTPKKHQIESNHPLKRNATHSQSSKSIQIVTEKH